MILWKEILKEGIPEEGFEVIGYNKSWINEDYNPEGTCLCFINDDDWIVLQWCGYCDEWHTKNTGDSDETLKLKNQYRIEAPTHWTYKPKIEL